MYAVGVGVIPNPVAKGCRAADRRISRGGDNRRVGGGWANWCIGRRGCNRLVDTGIDVVDVLPGTEVDIAGHGGSWVDITVGVVIASLILRAELEAARQGNADPIATRAQIDEAVDTIAIGLLTLQNCVAAILQLYCHTRNTRFTPVLNAVAVEVIPDAVAQRAELGGRRVGWAWRGRLINTGVPVGIILTGSKGDTVRDAGGGVDVRVHRVIASLIL